MHWQATVELLNSKPGAGVVLLQHRRQHRRIRLNLSISLLRIQFPALKMLHPGAVENKLSNKVFLRHRLKRENLLF